MGFVTDFVGDLLGTNQQADSAQQAAYTQSQASQAGIDESRRQFDKVVELLSPFVNAGKGTLDMQQVLLGLGDPNTTAAEIEKINSGPIMSALTKTGEEAILSNASATGGLRGGNVQRALAQFRPQLLSQLIQQQFQNLSGISNMGQASAAGTGTAALNTGSNVAKLLEQQGAATAGGQIAAGSANRNAFGDLLKIGSVIGGFF